MCAHKQSSKEHTLRRRNEEFWRVRRQIQIDRDNEFEKKMQVFQPNDKEKFSLGEKWFNSGMKLEDASIELQENHNFVKGFERAQRIQKVSLMQYEMGREFYEKGVQIEQIPELYRNSPNVIQGYNDASKNSKSR